MNESNPFGHNDHRPFSGLSDELVYGLSAEGTIKHISQVESGLRCVCRCPACDQVLVAKKGKIQLHHFAHHSAGVACAHVAETNAHIWAKEVLARVKRLLVPETRAEHDGQSRVVKKAQVYDFVEARLEKRLGTMVPDVILLMADGIQLIVEVRVTHACDEIKLEKLEQEGLSAIEIDLRRYRTSTDRKEIEGALLSGAPREWLSNAKQDKFDEQFRDWLVAKAEREAGEAQERAQRAARAEEQRRARLQRDVEQRARSLISAVRACKRFTCELPDFAKNLMEARQDIPWSDMRSVGFTVRDCVWQAELALEYLTDPRAHDYGWGGEFKVEQALRHIEDYVIAGFRSPISQPVRTKLEETWPDRRLPTEAVEGFLDHLASEGFLTSISVDEYRVAEEYLAALSRQTMRLRAIERRLSDLKTRIDAIITRLPVSEQTGFDFEVWHGKRLRLLRRTPYDLCERGDDAYREFERAIKQIELMQDGGPAVDELLGLPLAGEVERTQARERERLVRVAASRRKSLREAAIEQLGSNGEGWLSGPSEDDEELTRIDQAGLDDLSYQRARRELEAATAARRASLRAQAEAEACQRELRVAAGKLLDADRLDLFMRATHPRIGKSPTAHCVDRRTLKECLDLLAQGRRGAVR